MPETLFPKEFQPTPEHLKALAEIGEKEKLISSQTPEAKEIVFDLEEIRKEWQKFYQDHNLKEFSQSLPETISLTKEQIEKIKEKAKEGFNRFILLPSPKLQEQYLTAVNQETTKPLTGLKENQQYTETWLSETVKPNFPNKIKTLNRPDKPYLLFVKDLPEVEKETLDQKAQDLRSLFQNKGEKGLTLAEYLIFQRDYAERHQKQDQPHSETNNWTWLLDLEIKEAESVRVLYSSWGPGGRQVGVDSSPPGYRSSSRGARSSAIFEI